MRPIQPKKSLPRVQHVRLGPVQLGVLAKPDSFLIIKSGYYTLYHNSIFLFLVIQRMFYAMNLQVWLFHLWQVRTKIKALKSNNYL